LLSKQLEEAKENAMAASRNKKAIENPSKPSKKKLDPEQQQAIKNYSTMITQNFELAKKTSETLGQIRELQVEPWSPAPKITEISKNAMVEVVSEDMERN
jgi:hypothetical protein